MSHVSSKNTSTNNDGLKYGPQVTMTIRRSPKSALKHVWRKIIGDRITVEPVTPKGFTGHNKHGTGVSYGFKHSKKTIVAQFLHTAWKDKGVRKNVYSGAFFAAGVLATCAQNKSNGFGFGLKKAQEHFEKKFENNETFTAEEVDMISTHNVLWFATIVGTPMVRRFVK